METKELIHFVKDIVNEATNLKNKHTSEKEAEVNYACIFSQGKNQYIGLFMLTQKIGKVIKETPTGQVFLISPISTIAGKLRLLKIRKPDSTISELGDADFTVKDYSKFKKEYLSKKGFKLIVRENFEMIELVDPKFKVRAYFSNPPLDRQLKIR